MMKKRYKAIIFDLFDTIVNFDYQKIPRITTAESKGIEAIIHQSYDVFANYYPHIDFSTFQKTLYQIYKELWTIKDVQYREIPAIERFRILFRRLDIGISPESELHMEELLLSHMDLLVKTTLLPQRNYSLLEALSKDYPLALISNFDHIPTLYRILDMYDIRKFFNEIIVSVELGFRKPHKKIFMEMLKRLRIHAHEALYIGDNLHVDIMGSKNAGLDAVWLNKKGEKIKDDIPQPDYISSDLGELLSILA